MRDDGAEASAELLERYRGGHERAAEELFGRYAARLTALARGRLSRRLLVRTDPEDVVLSAWRSFFVGARDGRFALGRGGDLWRLLVSITLHKLCRQARRHTAARRAVAAEQPLTLTPEALLPPDGREPAPDEAAALADGLEAVLRRLDPLGRRVLELRLQGEPVEAIAADVGRSERTIRRTLAEVRAVAMRLGREGDQIGPVAVRPEAVAPPPPAISGLSASLPYGDYLLQRMIGAGGFGKVYQARRRSTDEVVAVKFLRKSFWRRPESVARFLAEAETVARLRHPGIVPIRGAGRAPAGGPFLVMDLIDGLDLAAVLRQGPVAAADAARWIADACEAVAHAHDRGVFHCDITPGNLLLGGDGRVLVTDFGLARSAADPAGRGVGGTRPFMAPEQFDPSPGRIGPATDVYGLGAVLFTLLTGRPPGPRAERLAEPPEPIGDLCRRCLAERPADRYRTPRDLLAALRTLP
jgi:DNA-directed RNA polymerase specialized sigma24 family protein